MNPRYFLLFLSIFFVSVSSAKSEDLQFFELRTYYTNPGKLEALHARFRDHTVGLFEKHGMANIAYWVPKENEKQVLIYLLGYPSKEAREQAWKDFRADPEWTEAKAASEEEGPLVAKVDSLFLEMTDYSPSLPFPESDKERVFEMRRYTTNEEKLDDLDARFRDHTVELFTKHGVTNLIYFHLVDGQKDSANTLLYFIAANSEEARNSSFKTFSQDPKWKSAREASEKDGKLLVKKGIASTFLIPTDYSPVK
ncbi:MAG: NIPSNAP family protein [Verrucomicrobiales bacterium]|nr:NIPSNAP family protein [Verrucomicrobiales bacterium]